MTNSWTLPVEEEGDDFIITFPPEVLEKTGWKPGDLLEWVPFDDCSYQLRKVTNAE
jgi:bifunctional DNA-binding transcriptional regulator/antitoxin component of YhaV-PrlF toxin-antitoxin module